ncbi:LuxR C-terminal-related transcriptional regulator [Brevibacillus sp. DP1.3A]|uniref:helix-turn-helix transcriptional regulator n=1 Tax=Brevibacillus sp. DP1.3A TaxID=2738867 RepID=UPI00156B15E0|nr:LuxR C-terminal-related transcriptional regulator [Brevibacillus sp. DP1.3A]MED1917018.1 LuxR C-terminal-related transcriptional regulator [Bacillus thuringiensis]UED73540.1 LuxR C-terminal-related transcriptional regulator [Brevibacillus sp. DP1.3A]
MVSPELNMYIDRIEETTFYEEKLVLAVRGFVDLFPFMGAILCNYSTLSQMGEGLWSILDQELCSIRDIRVDMRNMPLIQHAIREQKAVLLDSEAIRQFPPNLVYGAPYALILPISYGPNVLGYAGISWHQDGCSGINHQLVQSLSAYCLMLGKVLATDSLRPKTVKLSRREVEVMQRMSWGESVKEMADWMGISEFTVQDYIKSSLKKLGVQNRAQGVADAIRQRIIC